MNRKSYAAVLAGIAAASLVAAGVAYAQFAGGGEGDMDGAQGTTTDAPMAGHAMFAAWAGETASVDERLVSDLGPNRVLVAETFGGTTVLVEETVVGVSGNDLLVRQCVRDVGSLGGFGLDETVVSETVQQTVVGVYSNDCVLVEEPLGTGITELEEETALANEGLDEGFAGGLFLGAALSEDDLFGDGFEAEQETEVSAGEEGDLAEEATEEEVAEAGLPPEEDVRGVEEGGEEGGTGEFEAGDEEPPASEVVAP